MSRAVTSPFALRAVASLLSLAGLVACGADGDAPQDEPLAADAAEASGDARVGGFGRPLAPVTFGADGVTPPVSIPAFTGDALTLHARTEPGTCFALASLEDAGGRAWVQAREAGPYCTDCAVRTSVAKDEALFVLARDEAFTPDEGLTLSFGLVRCDTLTPLRIGDGQRLELSWLPREEIPERGRLALRFLVSEHSMLSGEPGLVRELVAELNDELAGSGIVVSLDAVIDVDDVAREARFSSTDLTELEAMLATVAPAPSTVDVVFAGCLRYDDLLAPPSAVDGFTPRVVGGAGPASAIFMPGRRCDGFSDAPATFSVDAYAHTLVHELGHFLGLYHSVETDGTDDRLGDTTEANVMNHNPGLAIARGFSPAQARRMRAHPWVQPLAAP